MDDEENYVVVTRLKSQTTLYYDTLFYGKHFHQRPRQRNNHKDDEKVVLRNVVLQEIADDYLVWSAIMTQQALPLFLVS